jgi:hypothetical protein
MGINQSYKSYLQTLIRPSISMPHLHINRPMNRLIAHHILLTFRSCNISPALYCAIHSAPLSSGPEYLVLVYLRGEIVTTSAKLSGARGVAWSDGRDVFRGSAEEVEEDFDVLV